MVQTAKHAVKAKVFMSKVRLGFDLLLIVRIVPRFFGARYDRGHSFMMNCDHLIMAPTW